MKSRDTHSLAGAYAMDALDVSDRARFERHLTRCGSCAEELAGLRETAARLGVASAITPPSGLKAEVLAAARQTRQQVTRAEARWSGALGRRRALLVAVAVPAAAVAVVLALVLGSGGGSGDGQQVNPAVAAVLTAKDAQMMTGTVAKGGSATIVMSHQEGALVFSARGLPALPGAGGYELWLIGPGGERPVGMIAVGAHGMAGPVVASGLRAGDHLKLMLEPSGSAVLDLRL